MGEKKPTRGGLVCFLQTKKTHFSGLELSVDVFTPNHRGASGLPWFFFALALSKIIIYDN
jgi:hypothetical protein